MRKSQFPLSPRPRQNYKSVFAERITRTRILKRKVKDRREESALCAFQQSMNPEDIINTVAEYFNIDRKKLLQRRSMEKHPRQMAEKSGV